MQPRFPNFDLYLVTDRTQTRERDLLRVLQEALEGGVRAVQLREKDLAGKEFFYLAQRTKSLCERFQARLFINDRIDIALGVDADGVQLGSASLSVEAARALLGPKKMIGVSTHSLREAQEAVRGGADFILFGPVYFTPSKAVYGAPQGLDLLQKVVEKVSLPVYAIGGVKRENIAEVVKTGIRGVALISAVMSASQPRAAAQEILKILKEAKA